MNIIKNCTLLLLLSSSLWAHGQTVGFVDYQALKPPQVVLSPDAKTMAFVDRNIHFKSDTLAEYYPYLKKIYRDTTRYDSLMTAVAYEGFLSSISELYNFDSIPLIIMPETNINDDSVMRKVPPLSWEMVDSICDTTVSDILVSFEDLLIFCSYKAYGNPFDGYWSNVDIITWTKWKIYDPFYRRIIDRHTIIDSLVIENVSNSFKAMKKTLPTRKEIMSDVAYLTGSNYAERISPVWKNTERMYFLKGDKRFKEANPLVESDKWDECIKIWERVYSTAEEGLVKARASYNLAVAHEIKGDILGAEDWITKSQQEYKLIKKKSKEIGLAQAYAKIIQRRKTEIRRIKELFEPEEY